MQTRPAMSNQSFKIEDGVELKPKGCISLSPINQAILDMRPGQSLYPATFSQRQLALNMAKRRGIKIACRKEGDAFRIFKLEAK